MEYGSGGLSGAMICAEFKSSSSEFGVKSHSEITVRMRVVLKVVERGT